MPNLNAQLHELARFFAEQVVEAIRGASLQELASDGASGTVANGRLPRVASGDVAHPDPLSVPTKAGQSGRLRRRSAAEIAGTLNKVVLLVKAHKGGLRAEEIRAKLGMQSKEMPRILKEGIVKKKLASKGHKRATTYTAK